ncbi:MAG: hypothetical protein U0X92_03055 [Anaerolineales bacterium]
MNEEKLDVVIEKLDKLIFWLKFSHLEAAKEYFGKILNTDRKKVIYQLSDGRSVADIKKHLKIVSKSAIPDLWADWFAKGILIDSSTSKGRKKKVIDLRELGL